MQEFKESQRIFEQTKSVVTGGVHSGFRYRAPFPIYFRAARGSKLTDVDGNDYLDCLVANGACILGHGHPKVVQAVQRQLETGLTVGIESELSLEVARVLSSMIPSAEVVKLSNTGTEAVMHASQIARGYTRRTRIVKTEGAYHGWHDEANLSVHPKVSDSPSGDRTPRPESEGYSPNALRNSLVVPYNDSAALDAVLREEEDIAAFIVEPVLYNSGCILPNEGYLREVREITEKHGVLLIFDEVITGFRVAPGGAQQYFEVTPDVSVFGKAIANGFPLSAVVGRREVMSVTDPTSGRVAFSGTYNSNQPSLAASKACLEELRDGEVSRRLARKSAKLKARVDEVAERLDQDVQFQTMAGQFQVYFASSAVKDYRDAAKADAQKYRDLCDAMFRKGVLVSQFYLFHNGISDAHDDDDLETLVSSIEDGLRIAVR